MCVPVRSYSRSVLRLRSRFGGCLAGAGAEYSNAYDKQDSGNSHFSILVLLSEAMMHGSAQVLPCARPQDWPRWTGPRHGKRCRGR